MNDSYYFFYAVLLSSYVYRTVVECHEDSEFLREYFSSDAAESPSDIIQFWIKNNGKYDGAHEELIVKRSVENVTLKMKRSSVLRYKTPIYLAHTRDSIDKLRGDRLEIYICCIIYWIISDVVKLYEEPSLFSTVAHTLDEYGHPYFIGYLAGETITRISKRTARSLQKKKPHLFKQTLEPGSVHESGQFILSDYYALHTPKLPENGTIVLPPLGSPNVFRKEDKSHIKESYKRLQRSVADVVYPEILVVLDYNQKYTSVREFRFLNLIMYSIIFWNSVNLRFRSLRDPEVQLRLIGIVVSMERSALSFVNDNIDSGKLNALDANNALRDWAAKHFNSSYDIAVMQTNMDLFVMTPTGKRSRIHGISFQPVTCFDFAPNWMTSIVYDQMDLSGVTPAVHEIGHILGATHDTAQSIDYCSNTKNYIMSDKEYNSHSLEWSPCSKDDIRLMLRITRPFVAWKRISMGDCLDNEDPISDQGELIDVELLFGKQMSLKEQCNKRSYAGNCGSLDMCHSLQCHGWGPWFCADTGPVFDGTPCSGGQCEAGKCVPFEE